MADTTAAPLIAELETVIGHSVKIVSCPWSCDNGWRGCDACNRCGTTGSGFRLAGSFYPNTEEGFRSALAFMKTPAITNGER